MSETVTTTYEVDTCPECNGTGKIEQYEYTPPFEKFMGQCRICNGLGKVRVWGRN